MIERRGERKRDSGQLAGAFAVPMLRARGNFIGWQRRPSARVVHARATYADGPPASVHGAHSRRK